jgi:hypothetical protein
MDPVQYSTYKMGRILRRDEQWVTSLEAMMTPDEKIELQELLRGTPNQYGGTKAPSATKIYEFEERIYERKIQKDKEVIDELIRENEWHTRVNEQHTRHIEKLTSNSEQLINQVKQLSVQLAQLTRIVYHIK